MSLPFKQLLQLIHDEVNFLLLLTINQTVDILIHLYFSVDNDVLWGILSNDFPVLKGFLTSIDPFRTIIPIHQYTHRRHEYHQTTFAAFELALH